MLVSSGEEKLVVFRHHDITFQSRNRDACQFRYRRAERRGETVDCFNLAIEMLVSSGRASGVARFDLVEFQSRNRDACQFRAITVNTLNFSELSFNLAIEMLVSSGRLRQRVRRALFRCVSISQSRCLSVQGVFRPDSCAGGCCVSISQSRCLSVQATYKIEL